MGQAAPQGNAPAAAAPAGAPAAKLTPYTTPDKTASAGIPDGWKVTDGGGASIRMTGPKGEIVSLGVTFVVKDGPFHADKQSNSQVWLTMPNASSLAQKAT